MKTDTCTFACTFLCLSTNKKLQKIYGTIVIIHSIGKTMLPIKLKGKQALKGKTLIFTNFMKPESIGPIFISHIKMYHY